MADVDKKEPEMEVIPHPPLGSALKLTLISLWCGSQFMDSFVNTALFPAISQMQEELKMETQDTVWILAAYTAPFAAFLLISGRVADVYQASACPKNLSVPCTSLTEVFS